MLQTWQQLSHTVRAYLSQVHAEMCCAIDDEMAAQGKVPVALPAGHRVRHASDGNMRHTYRFPLAAPRELGPGDALSCRFPSPNTPDVSRTYGGTVAAASSRQLVVTFRDDLGDEIAAGGLYVPRECVSLVNVQDYLRRVVSGQVPFNARLALQLLGNHHLPPLRAERGAQRVATAGLCGARSALRLEQKQAVEDFCSRELSVLWGPPGTGKTHVISHGVVARAGKERAVVPEGEHSSATAPRILVVASSNLAVDELMSRIAVLLADPDSVRRGRVIRYGRQVTTALIESRREQIAYDRVVERIRRVRMQRAVALSVRLEARLDELSEVADLLHNLPVEYEDERSRLWRRHRRLEWYVKRFEAVGREQAERFTHAFRHVDGLAREILDSCQILGTTLHQAMMSGRIRDAHWDCIVLEEASQIPAALGYALALRAQDSVWLGGDFRQLEPVTEADTPHSRHWMRRDLFATTRCYTDEPDGTVATAPFVSRLEVQHRMHPEICAVVNAAYGGALRTDPAIARARLNSGLVLPFPQGVGPLQRGIYLIDTTELQPATRALRGGSRENPVHVAVVRALLEILDAHSLIPPVGEAPGRIAIISPFQAQARWISSIVERRYAGRGIQSGTIHSFQGQGVDLLIVDLTESRGLQLTDWMRDAEWSNPGGRLLTVALSRCKERCLVIADCGALYEQLQSLVPRPQVYRLLRHLEAHAGAIDVRRDIVTIVQALREARGPGNRVAAGD